MPASQAEYTGSIPVIRSNDVSVRTNRTDRYKNQSVKWLIFYGVLEIPAQAMPWLEDVVNYNESHDYRVKFVIFPYPAGGWAAQSVPPSIEKKFEQLVSFPKEWAGGNEKTLPKISEIQDATFCHNGCFFARSKTKESILAMCRVAMNLKKTATTN